MKELEKPSVLNNPEMVDVVIIEGMFFLCLLSDLLETFGFVRSILRKLCFSFFYWGNVFLHLLSNLPETFGFVSRSILRKLYQSVSAKRTDNVFDKVVTQSIKDSEHDIQPKGLDRYT